MRVMRVRRIQLIGTALFLILGGLAGAHAGIQARVSPAVHVPTTDGPVMVWSEDLTMEEDSDTFNTYFRLLVPSDNVVFTHDAVDYTVMNLFIQEFDNNRVRQLVFEVHIPLPDDLALQIDDIQFDVADARKLGTNRNIHIWRLGSRLESVDGQAMEVSLIEL